MRFMIWDLQKYNRKTALLSDTGDRITYAGLSSAGNRLAKKIGRRCLVFSLCQNTIGSVLGYIACVNNNIPVILVNCHLDKGMLLNLIFTYAPSFLWVPSEMEDEFSHVSCIYRVYGYSLLQTSYSLEYQLDDELALLLTTSGSTGSPKFVRQSYKNILSNTAAIISYLDLDETERPITTLPMNYTYGLSIINTHLYVGATILLTDKGLMQKEFWTFFKEKNATSFGGVPYTYEMLDRLRFAGMQIPSLRYMTQAGGKLTPKLHKKFAEYALAAGKKFVVMYGQCEATARMGYLPADKALEKCGSMGIAIPGGKFHLVDADGTEIAKPYVTGELIYEGTNVTLGYAECGEDLIKGDERKGVLQTGDMAQFDEDGYYYIVGRKKRFLKIYGNRVNLDEIDGMVKAAFDNIDVASAGIDDHMYIFVTEDQYAEPVCKYVAEKTKLNPAAFKSVVIGEIPKNDAGKILYTELAKYYE